MARPSPYDPSTDFADYSANNPGRPMRGQDLDVEFNALAHSIGDTQAWLAGITGDAGGLASGIVQSYHLAPGLVDTLAGNIYAIVGPTANQATSAAAAAQVYANNALAHRNEAQAAAATAYGEGDRAFEARDAAQWILNETQEVFYGTQALSVQASNWANASLGHANHSALSRDEAKKWAEFIGGPVLEDALDPDAYDSGLWSAKWWAIQAARWAQGLPIDPALLEGQIGPAGIAGPEGFGKVVYSLVELEGIVGPLDDAVALVTDPASIWHFVAGDSTPADGSTVLAPADSTAGRWHRLGFAAGGGGMTSNEFYEQPTPPSGAQAGALWVDTSDEI